MAHEFITTSPTYLDDPTEYERILRHNLSSPEHSKQHLIDCLVESRIKCEQLKMELHTFKQSVDGEIAGLDFARLMLSTTKSVGTEHLASCLAQFGDAPRIAFVIEKAYTFALRKRARESGNQAHSKPGGNWEKKAKILAIWATGNYSSRSICAEQECAALNMSYDAARKALINSPKPHLAAASTG